MRKGHASLTAVAVAAARALASDTRAALLDPHDRMAERFLPRGIASALELMHASALGRGVVASAAARVSLGMVDHLALRSAIIDRRIEQMAARGLPQLVILGAGFDTRAYRLEALRETRVYEVDHPDSQAAKHDCAGALAPRARSLVHVALDFTTSGVDAALAAAGHEPELPSLWLAEGLVPYLEPAIFHDLLRAVARASAAGSILLMSYVTPDLGWLRHARGLVLGSLRLIGEPMHNLVTPADVDKVLEPLGFRSEEDSDTFDWARELTAAGERAPSAAYERLRRALKT